MLELSETLIKRIKPQLKKDFLSASFFLAKLLGGLFSSCCEKILVTNVMFCSHSFFFFFIPNITAFCKNQIPPSSEPEMILKELENSRLGYFNVNLTDIVKIIAKNCQKVISKHCPKSLFIANSKPTITAKKMKSSIKDFSSKCEQIPSKLVTFIEEIINEKLQFFLQ